MELNQLIKFPYEYYMDDVAEDFLRFTNKDISIKDATREIAQIFLDAHNNGNISEYSRPQNNKIVTYYIFDSLHTFKASNERVLGYTLKNENYPSQEQPYFGMYFLRESLLRDKVNSHIHIADITFESIFAMNNFLGSLANECIVENWNFKDYKSKISHPILKNYLANSYYQALYENKVHFNKNEKTACFNTGLLDPYFNEIFIVCDYDDCHDGILFQYCELRRPRTIQQNHRRFQRYVTKTPELACFYEKTADLLFNSDINALEINIANQHIFEDNLERINDSLPPHQEKFDAKTNISACVQKFRTSIAYSLELAKRNYKLIAPQFWPENAEVQYLMPIYLDGKCEEQNGSSKEIAMPNVALCLEKVDNVEGIKYRGTSILTLDMAYQNARLIAKPDSFWLEPDRINASKDTNAPSYNAGDKVSFKFERELFSKKPDKPIIGLIGTIGDGVPAMLHIKNLAERKVNQEEMRNLVEICKQRVIEVSVIDHSENGWNVELTDRVNGLDDLFN